MKQNEKMKTLFGVFLETVEKYPNLIALESGTLQLSYSDLNHSVLKLGNVLKVNSGQSPFIISLLPADASHVITTLAIRSIKKVVAVMNDTYRAVHIGKCLTRLNYPLVVTTQGKWKSLPEISHSNVYFVDEESLTASHANGHVQIEEESKQIQGGLNLTEFEDVAYCLFTSGSTGEPKPVLVTETCVQTSIQNLISTDPCCFNLSMRGLMGIATSFIPSLADIWTVFYSGGTLVIPSTDVKLDMDRYRPWINKNRITTATFATPVMEALVSKDVDTLDTLQWVAFGGARPNERQMNLKTAKFNAYNIYGGTEFFIGAIKCIPKGTGKVSTSVGGPLGAIQIYILDEEEKRISSPEVRGEIYVAGGKMVMKGYIGLPELTEKVLVPNPFEPKLSPMYKTGDFGYWSDNCELHIVGREDEQVKIHGMRLELGEIATTLTDFVPGIYKTVAIVRKTENVNQIVAFCTLEEGAKEPVSEVIEEILQSRLQRHAMPSSITFLKEFPMTPTGKIDRVMLAQLAVTPNGHSNGSNEEMAEESELMKLVKRTWEEAIGLTAGKVKLNDNFFYIGGNSLLVFKIMGILRKVNSKFNDVNPLLLFQCPILKEFVAALNQEQIEEDKGQKSDSIDFLQEILLLDEVQVKNNSIGSIGKDILITGTTGFLGSHLLLAAYERFENEDVNIVCVIRGKTDAEAKERLKLTLDDMGHENVINSKRIHCIAGDLTKPKFGMNDAAYAKLLSQVGIVFHSAAEVSFVKTYEVLKHSTVAMITNILRFAMEGPKQFNFMSTIGVFDGVENSNGCSTYFIAREDRLPSTVNPKRMVNGYFQSKWVSEQLVWAAGDRGLPTLIFRIGQVGSHSITKMANHTDALAGFVIACHKLRLFPHVNMRLAFVDADEAVSGIINVCHNLSQKPKSQEKDIQTKVFHIVQGEVGLEDFMKDEFESTTLKKWEEEFRRVVIELKSEADINAWLFVQMLKEAEESLGQNRLSLLKNIRFSTKKASEEGCLSKGSRTMEYVNFLINDDNKLSAIV